MTKNIAQIVKELKKRYSTDEFAQHHSHDPYRVLIGCLLSLRTKDEVTYPASTRLFKLARTPSQMLKLSNRQIEKAIYPVGFYITKAKRIKGISKTLIEEYGSKVPDEIDELVKLKGVGRKTANIVVTFGFRKQGIAVDTHVHRISNRLGWVRTTKPDDTEMVLRKILPRRYWLDINELLVRHGQNICNPVSPWCSKCMIREYCKRNGVERSR